MASILIVDDDHDILKLGSHILSASGHYVFTALDAQEALDHLNQRKFDLVISDANMPRHSGYDLLQTIKKNKDHKDIPVAFLTGRKEKKDIERAVALGASDYIVKPLDPFLLIQKVNQLLSRNEKQSANIEIAKTKVSNKAYLSFRAEVQSISEVGLDIISSEQLQIGLNIKLDTPIFKEIGIEMPYMKVLSCIYIKKENIYNLKLYFMGMKEKDLSKIRSWMLRNTRSLAA